MEEAAVRHIVGSDGARAFIEIIEHAWKDALGQTGGIWYNPTTRANDVWDAMARRADAVFSDSEGVEIRMSNGKRPFFVMRDTFAMRLKMHDGHDRTRNYLTSAQEHLRQSSLLPGFELPIVDVGYRLDAAGADIEQCLITCPADDWKIDLDDLADGGIAPLKPVIEFPGLEPAWRSLEPIRIAKDQ